MAVKIMTTIQTWIGVSGDSKPSSPAVGSTFYETDTRVQYKYDGSAWKQAKVDGWTPSAELAVGTNVVKASAGQLHGFLVETGGTNDITVQFYDHASTATTPITPSIVVAGGDNYGGAMGIDAVCSAGIVCVHSGAGGIVTAYYA